MSIDVPIHLLHECQSFLAHGFVILISPDEMEQIGRWLKLPKALTLLFSLSLKLLPVVLYDMVPLT